jgi:hypothetical protein
MISPQLPKEVPSRVPERTLREFAGLCLLISGGLFALGWYRHQHLPNPAAWTAGALAALIGVPGLIQPNAIRPIYLGAMALTRPIGHFVGLSLLAVVYYGVLTPMALAFRLVGRDGLGRHRWGAESYWVDHLPTGDVRRYLRQYQHQVASEPAPSAQPARSAAAPSRWPATVADRSNPPSPAISSVKH